MTRREQQRPRALRAEERAAIRSLGRDLKSVWPAPATSDRDRKELLRALLEEVIIALQRHEFRAQLTMRWRGGAITQLDLPIPRFQPMGPMRVGKYAAGATDNDKNALLRAVSNIGTDCAAIIPESMLIEFIENKQTMASADLYEKLCAYLDQQVTMAVLGQELTTTLPRGAGSRAAAEVHDVVRRDIATDDARKLCATIKRDLIKPLIDLNRGQRQLYPSLKLDFERTDDQTATAQALSSYIDRGMPVAVADIHARFGLRKPDR